MPAKIDMVGVEVNGLKVVSFSHKIDSRMYWNCICPCGESCVHNTKHLRLCIKNNLKPGCGCTRGSLPEHGLSATTMYWRWNSMHQRCNNPDDAAYPYYGGRGISICDRWKGPALEGLQNFIEDMGHPPEGMSLDRVDVNGNYSPENCLWATRSTQGFNKRISVRNKTGVSGVKYSPRNIYNPWVARITFMGKEIQLGAYNNIFDATCARKSAELFYYPERQLP